MRKRAMWLLAGALLVAAILVMGYISHENFKNTLIGNFNVQQGLFAKSIDNSIRNHIHEVEKHILHVVREIKRADNGIEGALASLPDLTTNHLDTFEAFGLFDHEGEALFTSTEEHMHSEEDAALIQKTIDDNRLNFTPFLSERFTFDEGRVGLFLAVPFRMPGRPKLGFYAVGVLSIEDFILTNFPSRENRVMGFVLADGDGDILSMMNTKHEIDEMMKRGNLFDLGDECLSCHRENDFQDVREAVAKNDIVYSMYRFPVQSGVTTNRVSHAFAVYNQIWSISIFSPFESIQRAIDQNAVFNLMLILFALLLVGVLSYAVQRSIRLEEIAETARQLRESREALDQYAQALEEANRFKDFFTDIVRHDLMNPLATVKGYTQILSERAKDPSTKEIFSAMKRSLNKLIGIIHNSATITKLEGKENFEFRYRDLGEIIDAILGDYVNFMEEKNITLVRSMEGNYPVMANPLIDNIFQNLVSNAVKFSPSGKKIEVGIRDAGERWEVIVKDWGKGIKDEHKVKIFRRLERLGKEGKGTGLGLAIVQRLVDLHRGSVRVEDNKEGGSVFIVSLPKADL